MMNTVSQLEEYFLDMWEDTYPELELDREVKLIPGRAFRFDFAHLKGKVAIEIHGGNYKAERSGHSTSVGLKRDYEKANLVQLVCFYLIALDSLMVKQVQWYHWIADLIIKNIERNQINQIT